MSGPHRTIPDFLIIASCNHSLLLVESPHQTNRAGPLKLPNEHLPQKLCGCCHLCHSAGIPSQESALVRGLSTLHRDSLPCR